MRRAQRAPVTCVLLVLGLAAAGRADAQLVSGRVLHATSGDGLNQAAVLLIDSIGSTRARVITDTLGAFRLMPPLQGTYRLRAELIGFRTYQTDMLPLALGRHTEVELRLAQEAIALEPLKVVASNPFHAGRLHEYYQRVEWTRRVGMGRVFVRDEVERMNMPRPSNFLMFAPGRGGCSVDVLLDGIPIPRAELDGLIDMEMLEGVEIYRGATEVPPEYNRYARCGVAMFWTRRDVPNGRPFSWRRLAAGVGLFAGVLLLLR
jgi:hypothetical protein